MKVNTSASVAPKASPTSNNNNDKPDKCRALIEKLMQQQPNNWAKLQEQLKKLDSTEMSQTERKTQIRQKEPTIKHLHYCHKNIYRKTQISNKNKNHKRKNHKAH